MKKKLIFAFCIFFLMTLIHGKDTFTVVFSKQNIDFNPHKTFTSTEAQLYSALYEGLLSYHPQTLEPLPASAQSWKISEDGLTYTFKLRDNLVYNNGESITANHFKESWLKIMSLERGSEYGSLLNIVKNGQTYREGKVRASQVGIEARSNNTLIVTLERKAPQLLKVLCHHAFSPLHPSMLENDEWDYNDLISNGPYELKGNSPDQILFERNAQYWDKENVAIKNITIQFSDEPKENSLAFNRDDIDWLTDRIDFESLNVSEAIVLNPLFSTTYLFFSNKSEIWQNGNLRKALALLLPWEKIRATQPIPGSTLIPPIPSYPMAQGILKANENEAFKLLTKEGFENGEGLPSMVLRMPSSELMLEISEMMKETWNEKLGIEVTIESEDYPDYFNSLKKDDYTIGSLTWIGDYADPMTFLEMWLTSSSLNDASFSNSDYDAMLQQSSSENLTERYKIMSESESILLDSAQVLPIGHSPALNIIDLRFIDGWYPNVLDIHPFKYLKFKAAYSIPGTV